MPQPTARHTAAVRLVIHFRCQQAAIPGMSDHQQDGYTCGGGRIAQPTGMATEARLSLKLLQTLHGLPCDFLKGIRQLVFGPASFHPQ